MIDLHIHSHHSLDGELSPKALVDMGLKQGLKLMSITDHNNYAAFIEGVEYAKRQNITLIPGIEIDCIYKDVPLHLLAYGLSHSSKALQALCENQLHLEIKASRDRVDKAQQLGFDITEKDFSHLKSPVITAEDIGDVLLSRADYKRHPLLLPYRKNGIRSDNPLVNFYWDYYSVGKNCFVKIPYPKLEDIIRLIHDNGGIAILAHPGITFKYKLDQVNDIIKLGIDGLEVFSSYHSPLEIKSYFKLAQDHQLIMTAGSDFHGQIKPSIGLGDIDYLNYYDSFITQLEKSAMGKYML